MTASDEGLTNLVRVLQAPPQDEASEIKILTLELYEGGLIVRDVLLSRVDWEALPGESGIEAISEEHMKAFDFALRDDLGTEYRMDGAGADGEPAHGLVRFKPAVPDEAQWLDVITSAGFVRFELRD